MESLRAHRAGRGFATENPANSYTWELESAKHLSAQAGVMKVIVSNCLFEGGSRNKLTAIATNVRT